MPADVSVELLRRRADGTLVPWLLEDDGDQPVHDAAAGAKLEALRALLDGTLDVHLASVAAPVPVTGTVALDVATLAALEQTSVTVLNPTDVSALATDATLAAVRDRTAFPLPVEQVQALKPPASQPVSGPLTDAQLAARLPLPVETELTAAGPLALEATLAAIRDEQYRRTDPLPAGTNTIGHVLTVLEAVTLLSLPSAARTASGTVGPFAAGPLSRVAFDATVSVVTGTLSPSMIFVIERQGADSLWYPMYTSPAITAARTVSTSIGQGMTVGQSLGASIRLRWEVSGTSPSFTFSASLVGK